MNKPCEQIVISFQPIKEVVQIYDKDREGMCVCKECPVRSCPKNNYPPSRFGLPWDYWDRKMFHYHWKDTKGDIDKVARRLGRTPYAIVCRIRQLLENDIGE